MPSYNQGHLIEETILSIIEQSYANYELIIIDGGSTDDTIKIIRKYERHIAYWVSEPDRGQSHAIQKGLDKATGDIINWINSDDLLAPNALQKIANQFDLEKYDVFCGKCNYFINKLACLDKIGERMGIFSSVGETLLHAWINQPSTFFKGSIIKYLGVNESFRYTMDVDLWYRYLLERGHQYIQLSDELLTYFRLHENSKTVAEGTYFNSEINKVFYNTFISLNSNQFVANFIKNKIPNKNGFLPQVYSVKISKDETKSFVREMAWRALIYYNEIHDNRAARECLLTVLKNKPNFSISIIRQIIKQYFPLISLFSK